MFIIIEVTRPAMLFRKFGAPAATMRRVIAKLKRGRRKRNCALPRKKGAKAIAALTIMPRQVASDAPHIPKPRTPRNRNSSAQLIADMKMLSAMLPRT